LAEDIGSAEPRQVPRAQAGTDSLTALASGARIGKYEIIALLGQGGFGITYRAIDTQLDREVAIKEYLPVSFAVRQPDSMVLPRSTQLAEDFSWGRERFLDEAKTLARFESAAGIVNVHDFLEANGTAYMVMGLVRGETLEARLRRERRLSQAAIEQLLHPLLDGLEQVHAASFLHRDIKPANILVDDTGRPTLIDFGASRLALQDRTQSITAILSPGYAAFEQSSSTRQGPWTDIYAIGATLYHCIAGATPPSAIDRMIEDTLVPAVEAGAGRYAPSLLAAVDAALRLKAADRPQTIRDWRRLLSIGPASSLMEPAGGATRRIDVPAPAPQPRPTRRFWWPRLLAGSMVALILTFGGVYVWQRDRDAAIQEAALHAESMRRADEEAARRAAQERERIEVEAKRRAEEASARRAADEKARADAEARRRAEEEAAARQSAEERARAAASRRQAEEEERRQAEEARRAASQSARDCSECPDMVRLPAGSFVMGADGAEEQREGLGDWARNRGLPRKRITIRTAFWMSRTEVTIGQFRAFVEATNRDMGAKCWVWAGKWTDMAGRNWRDPGFPQSDTHPVTCVSSTDAIAYAAWLSQRTGRRYRLASEAEWEYAARAGTVTARYWGDEWGDGDRYATIHAKRGGTTPAGSLIPNAFGLHDILGNVWEWTMDAYNKDLAAQPEDGSPRTAGAGGLRILRGGSWAEDPSVVRAGYREAFGAGNRGDRFGIRVVREDR